MFTFYLLILGHLNLTFLPFKTLSMYTNRQYVEEKNFNIQIVFSTKIITLSIRPFIRRSFTSFYTSQEVSFNKVNILAPFLNRNEP